MRFLFEIGLEELPSRYVDKASNDLLNIFSNELKEYRISFSGEKKFNSPRRIAIYFENISEKQDDFYEKKIGPSTSIAYVNNELTKAALGFLKSQNVDEKDIKIEKNDKGEYIYIERNIKGRKTKELLPEILDKVIRKIEFDKTMKWSNKVFRFARPIKWLLATLNDEILNFEFEGIKSSNITRGMRFFGNENIVITDSTKYEKLLEENFVIADPEKRKKMIIDTIKENCENDGDRVIINKYLLDEVVNLVEYPYAIKGEFNKDYLKLPEDIITITMETHQRYFPVKDSSGNLTNKFILIRNAPVYSEFVKKGNEKVIEPRLADAKFFFDEDLKVKLETNVLKLKEVTFQKDMGTIFDKINRSQKIAKYIIDELNLENEEDILKTIYLSKADLVSNVISEKEFTKLQGFMGYIYALNEGYSENISKGIFEHYLPRFQGDILASTTEGSIASISDKLDTVIGCFSVNLIPTSSKDPYALRRASQGLILTALNSKLNIDYEKLIEKSFEIFSNDKQVLNKDALKNVKEFFKQRLEAILSQDFNKNIVLSQINLEKKLINLKDRLTYLTNLSKTENYELIINLIKRLKNISKVTNTSLDTSLFETNEEKELYNFYIKLEGNFKDISLLIKNHKIFDNFFEKVIINTQNEKIKNNRLELINELVKKLDKIIEI